MSRSHYRAFHRAGERRCAIRACRDVIAPLVRLRICPSCRAAGRWGIVLAGAVAAVLELLRQGAARGWF